MLNFPTSNPSPLQAATWRDLITPGDIVMFRFPSILQPVSASPTRRPCLVFDLEAVGERQCIVLAPALPAHSGGKHRVVRVARHEDFRAAGLGQPMQFSIGARLLVSSTHDGFIVSPSTGSPILGRLPGAAMERMQAERARLHALRDIRLDRLHSRDRHPHRPIPMPRVSAARSRA